MNDRLSPSNLLPVIATLRAIAGKEGALLEALKVLAEASRQEPGCVRYELHVQRDDPATLVVYELWHSDDALQTHIGSAHFQHFMQLAEPWLAAPLDVQMLQAVE